MVRVCVVCVVVCVLLFELWCCCALWCVVCHAEKPPCVHSELQLVHIQNAPVCTGTTDEDDRPLVCQSNHQLLPS